MCFLDNKRRQKGWSWWSVLQCNQHPSEVVMRKISVHISHSSGQLCLITVNDWCICLLNILETHQLTADDSTQIHLSAADSYVGPTLLLAQHIWLCVHSPRAFTVWQWANSHHPFRDWLSTGKKKKTTCKEIQVRWEKKKNLVFAVIKQLLFYFFPFLVS